MDKTILYKIKPLDEKESFFCQTLEKIRSPEVTITDLAYAFMHEEEMSFAEASAFAHSALALFESLTNNLSKFESKSCAIIKVDRIAFEKYCRFKNWSVKKIKNDFYARDLSGFKAKYEESSKTIHAIVKDELDKIQFINELEEKCFI